MKMKISTILASLTLAGTVVSGVAVAADGRVDITGEVTASTCVIDGSAGALAVQNVTLPPVTENALAQPGSFAGTTPVSFAITGCDTGMALAEAHFEPISGAFTANGNIANGGTANGVEIQLLDKDYAVINLLSGSAAADLSAGAGNLQMHARYFSPLGSASAGTVSGSAQFSMTYQ